MNRTQGVSQEFPAEMNTRRGFVTEVTLLWNALSSLLAQEVRSMLAHERVDPIYIPREITIHAGGKLLVATRSAPQKVRGEAHCIGYIDTAGRSYAVYQIHIKTAFSSEKLVQSLLFILDNNVFHEYGEWSASPCAGVSGQEEEDSPGAG
jgi:hypothetical protein